MSVVELLYSGERVVDALLFNAVVEDFGEEVAFDVEVVGDGVKVDELLALVVVVELALAVADGGEVVAGEVTFFVDTFDETCGDTLLKPQTGVIRDNDIC
jgi:hypothetical protein